MGCKALQLQDYFQLIDSNNDYGKGQTKTLKYDSWGKLTKAVSVDGDTRRVVFNKYDEFDRVVKNTETVFNKDKAQSAIKLGSGSDHFK